MAVGVAHAEEIISNISLVHRPQHLDPSPHQIISHARGVVCVQGEMVQLVCGLLVGGKLHILSIVNLYIRDPIRAIRPLQREGLRKAQEVLIEHAGFAEVAGVNRHVRDAQDSRTFWTHLGKQSAGSQEKYQQSRRIHWGHSAQSEIAVREYWNLIPLVFLMQLLFVYFST